MAETSFPLTGQDFKDDQWSAIVGGVGDGICDDWGNPYAVTVNTNDTVTVGVSSTGVNRAVVNGFGHRMDAPVTVPIPAVTTTTRYHLGLLYDPASSSSPVTVQVLKGTTPQLTAGQRFVPLHTFDRASGQTLQAATSTSVRPRRRQTLTVPAAAALDRMSPLLFLYGTEVYAESEDQWFRTAGNAAAPRWDVIGAPNPLAGYSVDSGTAQGSDTSPRLIAARAFNSTGRQTVLITVTATARIASDGLLGAGNMFIALNSDEVLNPSPSRLARVTSDGQFVSLSTVAQTRPGSNNVYFRVRADSKSQDLLFLGVTLGVTAIS